MKDALEVFCGCLQMRKVLSSTKEARAQTTTRLHASKLARASKASVRVTHSAVTHITEEKD